MSAVARILIRSLFSIFRFAGSSFRAANLDLQKLLTSKKSSSGNNGRRRQQNLIAYTIAPLNATYRDRFLRCDWAPGILVFLFIVLVFVASAQVVLIHYGDYGSAFTGYSYTYGANGPHLLPRLSASDPPPKININSLLNRNVPSIMTNLKKLQNDINVETLNSLLSKQHKTAASGKTSKSDLPPSDDSDNSKIDFILEQSSSSFRDEHDNAAVAVENGEELQEIRRLNRPTMAGRSRIAALPTATTNYSTIYSRKYKNFTSSSKRPVVKQRLLADCPLVPKGLMGRVVADINHTHSDNYSESSILSQNFDIQGGGWWRPSDCHYRHHVAIVVPYRDREHHLMVLLAHLHPMLQRQQLYYRIFVVEQYGNLTFNKARIMNMAFVQALKTDSTFGCFVFHDVDLIPEDDRNMYSCPEQPRHMSVAIDEMNYQIPYEELVGGVFAIRTEHFFQVNGYSNLYWGWGAEDDDLSYRLQHVGLKITRPPPQIGRYKMIRHRKRPAVDSRIRYRLLWTGVRRYKIDGINSLSSLNYKIISVTNRPLFTHILIDIGPPPPGF